METEDLRFMKRALRLAGRGAGRTHPNPMVGAVVVGKGCVLGEGWHRGPGQPHAEAEALAKTGFRAEGGTLYVNLEPCDHYGKTPPCTEAILRSGIARVVVGCEDPHPLVNGKGIRRLRGQGVEVLTGIGRSEAEELNRAFLHFARWNEPYVTLKLAATLDGRTADSSGKSRWITGEKARRAVHRLRSRVDAVLVGSGTVVADDPMLTVRGIPGSRQPLRIVLDPELKTPVKARIVQSAVDGRTVLITGAKTDAGKRRSMEDRGVRLLTLPLPSGEFCWSDLAPEFVSLGVLHLLVEGGPRTATWFLAQSAVRRIEYFVAMKFLGETGLASVMDLGISGLPDAPEFDLRGCRKVGGDVQITADAR